MAVSIAYGRQHGAVFQAREANRHKWWGKCAALTFGEQDGRGIVVADGTEVCPPGE